MHLAASDYGTVGLIDTPTARMSSDGLMTSTVAIQGRTNAYSLTYQATPWFEGTFRYTGFNNFHYYDRNYGVKLRLWPEQDYVPQVAVGIRDVVGTGIFSSEYVVASKALGDLDVSIGVGWGRLAGTGVLPNPMTVISDKFKNRERNDSGLGATGVFQPGLFFSGKEVGLFGGLSYRLDSLPLTLMLEYNPDPYEFEIRKNGVGPKSRWSAGLTWQPTPAVNLSISRQHNDEWGVELVAMLDTKSSSPQRPKPQFRSSLDTPKENLPPMLDRNSWYDMLLYDAERSGLILVEGNVDYETNTATIIMGNKVYPVWRDAIKHMTDLANLHLPKEAKFVRLVIEEEGHQVHTLFSERTASNSSKVGRISDRALDVGKVVKPVIPQHRTSFVQNKVYVDATVSTRFQFFDPDDPARYQVYGKLGASLALPGNWVVRGSYSVDIENTFKEITRKSNSVLPHVRSDIARYLTEGSDGLDAFYFEKRGSASPETHYRLFAGVLEEMYSGFGTEILYQPHQSRLAYGLSANRVQQRDYDKSFNHLDYKTNTAFASVYWATPFYNVDAALHAGRYLAKDKGATFELRRTFSNGWMIGFWATLTDVPFEEFGEGSFDKGMFFRLPLDGLLGKNVRASYATRLRVIQRDGGARLEDFSTNIWWNLRGVRYDTFHENIRRVSQ